MRAPSRPLSTRRTSTAEPPDAGRTVVEGTGPLHHVEQVMGTVFSLDVHDPVEPSVIERVTDWLHEVDARFSTYREDSEISRIGRGELGEPDASPDVREVLALCEQARDVTNGWFDIRGHRTDRGLDPSGLVKGWAIDRAGAILAAAGARNWSLNGGGDVLVSGTHDGKPWRVGVRHPDEAAAIVAVLEITDLAVATSALYERGDHIRDPHTGRVPSELVSVTIVGPTMTWTDTFATAVFAMGRPGLEWVASLPGYSAAGITPDGHLLSTPGFRDRLLRPGDDGPQR